MNTHSAARALVLAPFSEPELADLRRTVDVTFESWLETRRIHDPQELTAKLKEGEFQLLVVESDFVFEEVFQGAPKLRFVGICRASTNHVDLEAATREGVVVVNTPARNAQAVAEMALGFMLSLARGIPTAPRYLADGRWQNPAEPYITMRGVELAGRTLGLIGLGAVGRRLASMASALEMDVLAYDPYIAGPPGTVRLAGLDPLLKESDFLAVTAPRTDETEGMLDAQRIGAMKPSSYILVLSEHGIVSEEALVAALTDRRIAGAAVDVFETHPLQPGSPLLGLDNVILTPHLGGATEETVTRHSRTMACDMRRFLAGRRPRHLVNPEVWDRRG